MGSSTAAATPTEHECRDPACHDCWAARRGFWRGRTDEPSTEPTTVERVAASTAEAVCGQVNATSRRRWRGRYVYRTASLFLSLGGIVALMAGQTPVECVVLEQAALVAAVLSLRA